MMLVKCRKKAHFVLRQKAFARVTPLSLAAAARGLGGGGHLVLLVEHSVLLVVKEGRRGVASCFVQYVHG